MKLETPIRQLLLLLLPFLLVSCLSDSDRVVNGNGGSGGATFFSDSTTTHLPSGILTGTSRAVQAADLDNDGDLDLAIAVEGEPNIILINDSTGNLSDRSDDLPDQSFDTQALAAADYNSDGFIDLFFVSATDLTNELYLNDGDTTFSDASGRMPLTGESRAALAVDFDLDGLPDIAIGNNGQNVIVTNTGNAFFANQSQRIPQRVGNTWDLATGDLNSDGAVDLVVGNADENRLLINIGNGFFNDQTSTRLPLLIVPEETRDVDLADVDGDGDLDIYFANVAINFNTSTQDRLLLNDGQGFYQDVTQDRLPEISTNTLEADFADLEGDGDLDIVIGVLEGGIRVFINDGSGFFTDETDDWIPEGVEPPVTDFVIADFNADGLLDLYVCSFQSQDLLLMRTP
ncbi:MAG: VCBS repeat-containing protein [Balneolaceae bacterium]|nr:VCBS repeat-containing protein [Balneolaceae bacterium]